MGQCLGCFYHIPLIRRLSSNAQRSDTNENTGLVEAEVLNRSLENIFIHPRNKHHSKPNEADISRRNLSKCNQDNEQQKYGSCSKPRINSMSSNAMRFTQMICNETTHHRLRLLIKTSRSQAKILLVLKCLIWQCMPQIKKSH